jgi:dTMP kinase
MQGILLAIEGTDGSGKGTQFKLLEQTLYAQGYAVKTFDFPQYDQPSAYFAKAYLNGEFGELKDVGAYSASLFFALDRYQAAPAIQKALDEGYVVLCNRYTGSNMAHQATKLDHAEERRGFFVWLDSIEHQLLNIPRPTLSVVLRVPADVAQKLVDQKGARDYTDKKRDLHEADLTHLSRSVEVYDDLCALFPKDFKQIDCVRSGTLMSIEQVQHLVSEAIVPLLPPPNFALRDKIQRASLETKPVVSIQEIDLHPKDNAKHDIVAVTTPNSTIASGMAEENSEPLVNKTPNGVFITEAGKKFLADAVTDVDGPVYGFTDKMSPLMISAAMARLSRRADDMRVTILDEFVGKAGKEADLVKRVITAYGDDSVQQPRAVHSLHLL